MVEGGIENENNPFRAVNKNVMDNSKCSVAVFVDHGLRSQTLIYDDNMVGGGGAKQHFAMLFIGGPDDREGLSYAWRMCGNPKISLTVMRFIPSKDVNVEEIINNSMAFPGEDHHQDHDMHHYNYDRVDGLSSMEKSYNYEMEKKLDDQYLEQLRLKSNNQPCMYVQFIQEIVSNADEIVKTIGSIENDFDLIIAGRGKGVISPLTIGLLSDWNECPELGPLGDILVTSSLALNTSILIVQRGQLAGSTYEQDLDQGDAHDTNISGQLSSHDGHMTWQVKEAPQVEFAPFINRRARIVDAP